MLLRKHLIGFKIKKLYSIDLERIVFIELENSENPNKPIYKKLIIELMGKHSNIILTDENNIIVDSMRHTNTIDGANRDIYPTSKYIFPKTPKFSFLEIKDFDDFYSKIEPTLTSTIENNITNINNLNIHHFGLDKIISNTFNGISMSFVKKIIEDLGIKDISLAALELVYKKINEIIHSSNLGIIKNADNKDFYLYVKETTSNYSLNFELDDFYFEKETKELFKNYRNSILHFILSTLKKYEKRLENIDNKISECNDMEKYRLYGELITANLYRIPNKNISEISLENYYDENRIINIPLNKEYLPSINAKRYFKKYSKLKNALAIVGKQKAETISDINYIESVVYEINICESIYDIEEIYEEISENPIFENKLKLKKSNKKRPKAKPLTKNKTVKFNPLKYVIDGYTILVGRNNLENDYLTCKFANKHDIWFHTQDTHGSHVILKTDPGEIVSEEILLEAAELAVKHSKAKNSSHVPVDYCPVSFVKKPSGSKPGFVTYRNHKTLYVL